MGYESHPSDLPGGCERDDSDHAHLRHGRDRLLGFPVGRFLQPAPMLFTRDGHNVFLGDTFRGATAFLLCGGPSLKSHDLSKLQQRGVLTCAVNNAATVFRPSLWVSVDDPGSFSDSIWRDPGILKFAPLCHMEKQFTVRNSAGELELSRELVGDMPAVFGYRRNEAFLAEQWLYEDTFNWGNHSDRVDAAGLKGSRSVMFVALRLLFYLGVRRLFLLGCDFRMQYGSQNYAFEQDRSRSSVNGNNSSYDALNIRLGQLKPYFDKEGYEIYNCTPDSGLRVFPHLDYEQAVQEALDEVPQKIITKGMYDRKDRGPNASAPSADIAPPKLEINGTLVDPVAALNLPDLTLVTAVDRSNLEIFRWTWPTWMRCRAWLQSRPLILIHDPAENIAEDLASIVMGHPNAKLVPAQPTKTATGRDRWSVAYLSVPAEQAATMWYLRLEPEAVATRPDQWLLPAWFQQDPLRRNVAFVSHAWGYTKPADALKRLDEWGNCVPGLRDHAPLRMPYDPQGDSLKHAAISSWVFLGNTAWTREVLKYAADQLPCTSHDTFTLYCALRRQDPFVRWQMKSLGWHHTFGKHSGIIEQCRQVLRGETAVAEPQISRK